METREQPTLEFGDGPEADPVELLRQATLAFGDELVLATSLGPQSLVLLDLAHRHGLRFDVALIDTGLLFGETLALAEVVEERYRLHIRRIRPEHSVEEQALVEGETLWLRQPDRCCQLRKVEPMRRLLTGYRAWLTGLRRDQSKGRADTERVEWDGQFGLYKLSPLVDWSAEQVRSYLHEHQVPYNPLLDEGYRSVGCVPCTTPTNQDDSERAGRWAGQQKTECGLHDRNNKLTQLNTLKGNQ